MFTGLIEDVGRVVEASTLRGGRRLTIETSLGEKEPLNVGESIAVDGACLSVTRVSGGRFSADVVPETVARTTLGVLRPGRRVNLERSLRVGARLGGHWVQGHVDVTAPVAARSSRGADYRLRIAWVESIRRFVAEKGSVALQGVSLTVSAIRSDSFEVALVPVTLTATTLGDLRPGDRVNVEVDLLARYLDRLGTASAGGSAIGHGDTDLPAWERP